MIKVEVSIVLPMAKLVEAQIIVKPIQPLEMMVICRLMCFLCHITEQGILTKKKRDKSP